MNNLLQTVLLLTICGGFVVRSIAIIRHGTSPAKGRMTILGLSIGLLYGGILLMSIGQISFGDIGWKALEAGLVLVISERALSWLALHYSDRQLT